MIYLKNKDPFNYQYQAIRISKRITKHEVNVMTEAMLNNDGLFGYIIDDAEEKSLQPNSKIMTYDRQ